MTERLKTKFLMVIWGERYIEEFARVSLPSYLAPGNLPALARETDLEVLVMTSSSSETTFENEPTFAKVRSLCPVRYIHIDDLITAGNYGVTLTLAYARGIQDSGPEQTNTVFVFMNSDFILADGSLHSLVGKLRDGHRCIMAPSLRAESEQVLPVLKQMVHETESNLTIAPRDLVKLTFDNLHATAIGKTVTQDLSTCETHNQIYWQVDETTLLARYHLIFMLAIKPEVPIGRINSYCDYGFVPELVPSGEFGLLNDSDEFFMLELQSAKQELHLLRGGASTVDEIASELSVWTTREHRRFAEVEVIFRTGDPPSNLQGHQAAFERFFSALQARLSSNPVDHVDHFYWVLGLQAWSSLKFAGQPGKGEMPPEVGAQSGTFAGEEADAPAAAAVQEPLIVQMRKRLVLQYLAVLGRARILWGQRPDVPIWHYQWLDCRLVRRWLKRAASQPRARNLLICDESSYLAGYLGRLPSFDVEMWLGRLLAVSDGECPDCDSSSFGSYDNVLIHMRRANMRRTRHVLECVSHLVKRDGTIAIYCEHVDGEFDPSNFSVELGGYVGELLQPGWLGYRVSTNFAGGTMKRRLRLVERRLFGYLLPSSSRRIPLLFGALVTWPIVAALMTLSNLQNRNKFEKCPEFCSSFLVSLSRPALTDANAMLAKLGI